MAKVVGVSTMVGLCVPQMGMHSIPMSSLAGDGPTHGSMVVGYYHGKTIFIEPMVARTMLLAKRSFDLSIPDIPGMAGPYPRTFHADYDAGEQAYRFIFSGFEPGTIATR
jgi:hypothetical protein